FGPLSLLANTPARTAERRSQRSSQRAEASFRDRPDCEDEIRSRVNPGGPGGLWGGTLAAQFRAACTDDIDELLTLYRAVYGSSYTLPLGTDREVMAREINSPTTTWLVARQGAHGSLVASILGTVSPRERLGKLQGLAVHPDARGGGVARQAVRELSDRL